MIQLKTILTCVDNSGAQLVECIANVRMKRHSKIGDRIIVVIQKARTSDGPLTTNAAAAAAVAAAGAGLKVRRGDVRHAVVVRTRKHMLRKDGMVVRFDDNACALIGNNGEPLGTRINGIVGSELRDKQWSKILSLAAVHV